MTIEITAGRHGESFRIQGIFKIEEALHLVKEAMEDIGDEIEDIAKIEAPMGETGALKAHPVDKAEITLGILERFGARAPKGSPGGIGGRFVPDPVGGGELVATEMISLPEVPEHAKWVHNGTGIYGPRKSYIVPHHAPSEGAKEAFMTWKDKDGKPARARKVKGQPPNPYLERAFVIINREYIPARVARLRLEIKAL